MSCRLYSWIHEHVGWRKWGTGEQVGVGGRGKGMYSIALRQNMCEKEWIKRMTMYRDLLYKTHKKDASGRKFKKALARICLLSLNS